MPLNLVSIASGSTSNFLLECAEADGVEPVEQLAEDCWLIEWPGQGFKSLFALHRFPVTSIQEVESFNIDAVRSFVWDGLPVSMLETARYSIQLSTNHRLPWQFSELILALISDLGLSPNNFLPRTPEVVLSAYMHGASGRHRIFSGISLAADNLSIWAGGRCRIPRAKEGISRAENKLLEAWETFKLPSAGSGASALDLGAAPGGWTRILAKFGYEVDAVDPAVLDERLEKGEANKRISYHQKTARAFLDSSPKRYDLIVSDMKMDAELTARLLVSYASHIKRPQGRLLVTFKLGKSGAALAQARKALKELAKAYSILEARQLYFNRSEITVYAQPKP